MIEETVRRRRGDAKSILLSLNDVYINRKTVLIKELWSL
jgi:hypothetical protein